MDQLLALDQTLHAWVVGHRFPWLDQVMQTLSAVGRLGMVWLATAAVLFLIRRIRLLGLVQLALAIVLATIVADYIVKPVINRERPFARTIDVQVPSDRPEDASFPSGHATTAFAGALTMSVLVPAGAVLWWLLAIAIAYSRVYLGVHYPLDVAAAAMIGLGCAAIVKSGFSQLVRAKWSG